MNKKKRHNHQVENAHRQQANHDHSNHDHSHEGHSHSHEGHNHSHGAHGHHHFDPSGNKKGLMIALIITVGIMFLEFFGGLITNSLALLSDSGHMLNDASSLALSLVAVWFATKPASPNKTYGFHRFEILAALLNGVTLFVVAGFIIVEAYGRFFDPPTVASGSMMLIASIGLLANVASAWSLMRKGDVKNNINLRSAYLHVLGDALGSVGAIIAGLIMMIFGWYVADPIISVLVALLILRGAWGIIKHTVHVLMEGTPITINPAEVKEILESIEGVRNVHDLHIWTITSGLDSLSCHILIEEEADDQRILQQAIRLIADHFKIQHTTIQVENSAIVHEELKI
ncbi:cation transporter [Paenibacillus odorifer]|uniref:cation diffusion facilitator family transporter n=2 Tax=Paenibacillus TaxID=44249 RepID=UPI00096F0BF8|nr:cation diffusion facilitator family transporter [Paenibacillus odorifer]OME21965.1 cation transporter [Paenibacillus odorifer]OME29663.1 cation transporter [Paenibacillus odorifer]OME31895.1 cation transporter [Paenibacillus odorifer]